MLLSEGVDRYPELASSGGRIAVEMAGEEHGFERRRVARRSRLEGLRELLELWTRAPCRRTGLT
jgi:hypothetical protein